ncbi:unnamed protein product, partial [Rotaria magnacalcarata]
DVEIVDNQVIFVAKVKDLGKLERSKIPDNLVIEAKPVVAIIGAGAGKNFYNDSSRIRQISSAFKRI